MSRRGTDLSEFIVDLNDKPEAAAPTVVEHDPNKIVPLNILVTFADRDRLKKLSVETHLSIQKMGHEAWNMWLEARGLAPLKSVTANVPSGRSKR